MISESSLFKHLIKKYLDPINVEPVLNAIGQYERFIDLSRSLTKVNGENIIETMDYSINMIRKADRILSWVKQIAQNTTKLKTSKNKQLELEKITTIRMVEAHEELSKLTTKTDKENMKKFLIKEQLVVLEEEIEEIKYDEKTAFSFVGDAENLRESVYAYYQSVKKLYDGTSHKGGYL